VSFIAVAPRSVAKPSSERARERWVWFLDLVHAGLAATIGLTSWWPLVLHPGGMDPSLVAIHRSAGDVQYFPIISGLARLNLGENQVFEQFGSGVRSFPFAAVLLHATCVRLFGVYGWMIADLIVPIIYFLLGRWLFVELGLSRPWASLFSIGMVLACFADAMAFLHTPSVVLGLFPSASGSWLLGSSPFRLTRPYVTELFVLFAIVALLRLVLPDPARVRFLRRDAIVAGIAVASLVQADIYGAAAVLPVFFAALGIRFMFEANERERRRDLLVRVLLFVGTIVLLSVPFLVQRRWEHPDVPGRLGLSHMPRDHVQMTPTEIDHLELALVSAAAVMLPFVGHRLRGPVAGRRRLLQFAILFLVAACGAESRELFVMVTGSEIQNYHFAGEFERSYGIAATCLIVLGLHRVVGDASARFGRLIGWSAPMARGLERGGCALGTLAVALFAARHARADSRNPALSTHIRPDFHHYAELGPSYFDDFRQLAAELTRRSGPDFRVLATLDHEVATWWVAFREGLVLNPDPFSSTLPDDELESRLAAFGSVMGLDPSGFTQFITQGDDPVKNNNLGHNNVVVNFFLSHNKYGKTSGWRLSIPTDELQRLEARYREQPSPVRYRIDGIVHFARGSLAELAPDPERFVTAFENATFKLYVPRGTN
jgi:hypothetical protein